MGQHIFLPNKLSFRDNQNYHWGNNLLDDIQLKMDLQHDLVDIYKYVHQNLLHKELSHDMDLDYTIRLKYIQHQQLDFL